MCYVLYIASPLTLSEVRSMLPAGFTADGLAPDDERRFRGHFHPARTAARLLIGPCTCDLLLERDPDTHREESVLRARYGELRMSREAVIRALDGHRGHTPPERPEPPAHWQHALAGFVGEHARNAGPTVYWLHFAKGGPRAAPPEPPPAETITVADVRAAPATWLAEDKPVRVVR
ncbi:MAG: hypothetical protein H0U85_09770 [Gemmatimonadales bacterium]|nr:hypothetical protein [Gemmatimonadales bacterium]